MSPEQWEKVSGALDHLLALAETERDKFLAQLRSDDPELCHEVESLAKQHDSTNLFESPPSGLLTFVQTISVINGEIPKKAGRFDLCEEIARGGMGAVLRAFDPDIQRVLAVKMLLPATRGDKDTERRFLREAQITGRLQHPGIPPIHEMGRLDDGSPFFAMKLIEGQTLASMLAQPKSLGAAKLVGIFEQICRTLAYAHGQKIIHRDLKPSNIMVGAFGEVQVMDWGLAKELRTSEQAVQNRAETIAPMEGTQAGVVAGTPAYMAPEQARGETEQLDERCDVFGLGGILCAMLTGRPPFVGATVEMVRASAAGDLGQVFARLESCDADVELIAIARKCLEPNPNKRYRDAGEVADAVTLHRERTQERVKQAELTGAKAQVQAAEERRRRRLSFAFFSVVLVLLAVGAAAGFWYQNERQQMEQARLRREQEQERRDADLEAQKKQEQMQRQQERLQREAEQNAQKKHVEKEIATALDLSDKRRQELQGKLTDPIKVTELLSNFDRWQSLLDEATTAHQQAAVLAETSKISLDRVLLARLESMKNRHKADRDDLAIARELDDIRLETGDFQAASDRKGQWAKVTKKYEQLFTRLELNPLVHLKKGKEEFSRHLSEILRRIQESPLRNVYIAALDNWVAMETANEAIRLKLAPNKEMPLLPHPMSLLVWSIDNEETIKLKASDKNQLWRAQARRTLQMEELQKFAREADIPNLSPQFLSMLAWKMHIVGGPAIPFLRAAIVHHPNDFWLHFDLGWMYKVQPNPDWAQMLACYRAAEALRPHSKMVCYNLGWVTENQRDWASAESYYKKVLAMDPRDLMSHFNIANVYRNLGELRIAALHARQVIELNANYQPAHFRLGEILVSNKDLAGADSALEKWLSFDPKNAVRWDTVGNLFQQHKEFAHAVKYHEKAVSLDAKNPVFQHQLGLAFQLQGKWDEAIANYEKAVRLDAKFALSHYNLGLIHHFRGQIAAAFDSFKKAHDFGSKQLLPHHYSNAKLRVKELERPAELEKKLPAIIAGTTKPKNADELIEYANLCRQWKKSPGAAVGLYRKAFAMDAGLTAKHRLSAVRAAVSAASDEKNKSEADRADYRNQALAWLKAGLSVLEKAGDESARKELTEWQNDPLLADVRMPQSLAKLTEREREAWNQFWMQVNKAALSGRTR